MTDEQYRKKMDQHNREVAERERLQAEKKRKDDREFYQRMGSAIQRPGATGGTKTTCFAAGTMVATAAGTTAIEALQTGDKVYAMSGNGELSLRPVHRFVAHRRGRIWEIVTKSQERPIATTGFHRFQTDRGWRWARSLHSGQRLRTPAGWTEIVSVKRTGRFEPVFNLVVEQDLNFIADGVIAHSFSFFGGVRTLLHRRELRLGGVPRIALSPIDQS